MVSFGEMFLNAFINCVPNFYVCSKLSGKKLDLKDYRLYIFFVLLTMILLFNFYFINSYVKVAIITIVLIFGLKYFLSYETRVAIVTALIFQVITFISELIFSISLLLLFQNNAEFIINDYIGTTLSSIILLIIITAISHIPFIKVLYKKLLNATYKVKPLTLIIVVFVLIVSVNLFLAMPYYKINSIFIVLMNAVMITIYSFIIFKFIQEKNRYIEISDKYSLTEISLKELQSNINRLRTVNHENKNQLLTIRTMVASKDKNILKNIDAIIEQKVKDDKFLKEKTSVIANTMLGALVYSKLLTMKDKKINCEVHIDKQISKLDFINLGDKTNVDICKIVGTYLDNAIDACADTKEKELYINICLEEKDMFIEISNTFKGNVNFEKINESGYTTKSDGHGYGLALAREIIKNNNNLDSETEVNDNVFTQRLKIKM